MMSKCNYCKFNIIRAEALRNDSKVITKHSNEDGGCTEVFVVPMDIELPTAKTKLYSVLKKYHKTFMKDIPYKCEC